MQKFLEELSWLLNSHSNLDFSALPDLIEAPHSGTAPRRDALNRHASKSPNIHYLVGTLPIIFSDEKLFPSNEDIAEFSVQALSLPIPRWEKRSRYELIGLIVCEAVKLDDARLEQLVRALVRMTSQDPGSLPMLRNRRASGLNWNEIIQKLTA